MKYLALLRGINVGGKNIIKMDHLKSVFSENGFSNVITYIQSGNVIFDSKEESVETLTKNIEVILSKVFKSDIQIICKSHTQLKAIIAAAPPSWNKQDDLRCDIAFVKKPVTPHEVAESIIPKDGIDTINIGPEVVYMTTIMSGLTKSGFTKLVGTKVYKYLTIRNYNTSQKILEIMEKE